jgi:predicted NBD/HSP70 family sugar kinase
MWLVNDAELAALSAAAPSSYAAAATKLVLTIGFGIGGALLLT